MITKNNSNKYQELFDKATEALNLQENRIESLEEYFSHIEQIAQLAEPIYLILPVDEEKFEVNLNTRQIIVPASFKKNGIGVKGDHEAEILFFSVDRFFDLTDLNNMDAFIQVETAPDQKGISQQRVYRSSIRDIESEPGKLIFEWVIDNFVTQNAGNVKFSVRFLPRGTTEDSFNEELDYSLGTLTSTVMVQQALNFDIAGGVEIVSNNYENVLKRLRNSVIGGVYVAEPYFVHANAGENQIVNLENGEYELCAIPSLPEGGRGTLSCQWFKNNTPVEGGYEKYELTTDVQLLANKDYYVSEGELYIKTEERPLELYERKFCYLATEPGEYYTKATHVHTIDKGSQQTAEKNSNKWIVPAADEVILERFGKTEFAIGETVEIKHNVLNGEVSYQWYNENGAVESANENTFSPEEAGTYYVIVKNQLNNSEQQAQSGNIEFIELPVKPIDVVLESEKMNNGRVFAGETLTVSVGNKDSLNGEVKYTWYRDDVIIPEASGVSLVASDAGEYYCEVSNITKIGTEIAESNRVLVIE